MVSGVVERLRRMPSPADCTCGAYDAYDGRPHEPGCPRFRDRSKSNEILDALERRYTKDGEWLFWREFECIDGFALRTWSGGIGYRRISFEVKVSRSDFRAEIRKPQKRQNALDLSHQYFFATPHGLVSKDEIPDECGLIVVRDGRARIAKHAPVRDPRALRLREAISLIRKPVFASGILEVRRDWKVAEQNSAMWERRADSLDTQLKLAQERLEEFAGHLVVKGSMWRGTWQPYEWKPAEENVECYVEEVREVEVRGWNRTVTLRRIDNGDLWRHMTKAEVLTRFVCLDIRAVAC